MTQPSSPPFPPSRPVPFLSIYSLNVPLGSANEVLHQLATEKVEVASGPFAVSTSAPIRSVSDGSTGIVMGIEQVPFPEGRYLIISSLQSFDQPLDPFHRASMAAGEIAAQVSMLFPGILADHKFEGFVNRPGSFVLAGAGPIKVTARADVSPPDFRAGLTAIANSLASQTPNDRERFGLAARWYSRGLAAENLVDKLLSWYISLEVHPASGTTDVPNAVRDYLHRLAFREISPTTIKAALEIGPIASMRAEIVHNGRASVGHEEDTEYERRLRLLELTVQGCLRLLAGMPISAELEEVVLTHNSR